MITGVSNELYTMLIAMAPISELRGAIPWALTLGGLGWEKAYLFSCLGNFLPVVPLLLFLEPVSNWLMKRFSMFRRFFQWLFARTRRRSGVVERYEALGLVLFVAIPLPVTGAWTGTVAAFLFGIRFWYALPAITGGILLAGGVVTLTSLGVINIF